MQCPHPSQQPKNQKAVQKCKKGVEYSRKEASREVRGYGPGSADPMVSQHTASFWGASPSDFAAAWKVSGSTTVGKRERAIQRPRQMEEPEPLAEPFRATISVHEAILRSTASQAATAAPDCEQDIPMPKFLLGAGKAHNAAAGRPPGVFKAPAPGKQRVMVPPSGLPPPGVFTKPTEEPVPLYVEEGIIMSAGPYPLQQSDQVMERGGWPLKIYMASLQSEHVELEAAVPCKKRVPDWGF